MGESGSGISHSCSGVTISGTPPGILSVWKCAESYIGIRTKTSFSIYYQFLPLMITVDRINNKASAAHLLFLIMESGSDNGNPYGLHPEPPIGIIVIQIPNIPTKKSSRKLTTSRRQPCQRPSFARPEIRQGEQFHTHDSVRRSIRNTTPHLEFIGNSPLHTSGQMSDDNGAERAAVDAAAAFVDATFWWGGTRRGE